VMGTGATCLGDEPGTAGGKGKGKGQEPEGAGCDQWVPVLRLVGSCHRRAGDRWPRQEPVVVRWTRSTAPHGSAWHSSLGDNLGSKSVNPLAQPEKEEDLGPE
jgi:hypothetical protein